MTTQSQTEALKLIADIASGSTTANSLQNIAKIAQEALAQPDYEKAYIAWQEKTEWVQETVKPHELGMHRADVLKQRIEALAQQSPQRSEDKKERSDDNEQVEPVASKHYFFEYVGFGKWAKCNKETYDKMPEMERLSVYTHPPVPYVVEPRTAQPKAVAPQHKQEPKCIGKAWAMWGGPVVFDPPLTQIEQRSVSEHLEPVAWMHWLRGPVRLFLNKDEALLELERLNRDYASDKDARMMRPLVFGDSPTTPPQRRPKFKEFIKWAEEQGYDAAHTCNSNTGKWICLNPMTADLWKTWKAAHGIRSDEF